jgi:hypothetical protein
MVEAFRRDYVVSGEQTGLYTDMTKARSYILILRDNLSGIK